MMMKATNRTWIALLLAAAVPAACAQGDRVVQELRGERVEFGLDLAGPATPECFARPARAVVRSDAELRRLLVGPRCSGDAWAVDFSRQALLVYSLGMQHTGGFHVAITDVIRGEDGALTVHVRVVSPRAGCSAPAAITFPRALATVPAFTGETRFHVTRLTERC